MSEKFYSFGGLLWFRMTCEVCCPFSSRTFVGKVWEGGAVVGASGGGGAAEDVTTKE